MASTEARFMKAVVQTGLEPTACWVWTARLNPKGYGQFSWSHDGKRTWFAHRVSYLLFNGPIPDGAEVDHLCRNRRCVRPSHLEVVTHAENVRRAAAIQKVDGECRHGHDLTASGTYLDRKGVVRCMECARVSRRKYSRKRLGAPV